MDQEFTGHKVRIVSTVGAGDAFNAGFIYQYLQGKDLDFCAQFANATAAYRVNRNDQGNIQQISTFLNL